MVIDEFMTTFHDLGVSPRLTAALRSRGIHEPTPVQAAAIPDALRGRDVLGRGRTGSGKTLAFLVPLVARLAGGPPARRGRPRALILTPTRELADQVEAELASVASAAGLRSRAVYGGVAIAPQINALRRGVDILIACPGRLGDLIRRRQCSLAAVEISVVDEADLMSDLGFLPEVRELLAATDPGGQRLLFSATLDAAVDELVNEFLRKPAVHGVDPATSAVAQMEHHIVVVGRHAHYDALTEVLRRSGRTIVFSRTKAGAQELAERLVADGVPAVDMHGDLNQRVRARNLQRLRDGRARVLVATDVAARGIHVDDVQLVVHTDVPNDPKAYLHRSGRTARAGKAGTVVTIVTGNQIRRVNRLLSAAGVHANLSRVGAGGGLPTALVTAAEDREPTERGAESDPRLAGVPAASEQRPARAPRRESRGRGRTPVLRRPESARPAREPDREREPGEPRPAGGASATRPARAKPRWTRERRAAARRVGGPAAGPGQSSQPARRSPDAPGRQGQSSTPRVAVGSGAGQRDAGRPNRRGKRGSAGRGGARPR